MANTNFDKLNFVQREMFCHLLSIALTINSFDILIKSDVASNDTISWSATIFLLLITFTKDQLSLMYDLDLRTDLYSI